MTKIIRVEMCARCPYSAVRRINTGHYAEEYEYRCTWMMRVLFRFTSFQEKVAGLDELGDTPPELCPLDDDPTPDLLAVCEALDHEGEMALGDAWSDNPVVIDAHAAIAKVKGSEG